uniref:Uncharacterized protein n=1 Tax=Setaria digitata TaxID=48799 RepID=A0A915PWU4_9BILA
MDCILKCPIRLTSSQRTAVLWNFSRYESSQTSSFIGQPHKSVDMIMRTKTRNKGKGYVEIIKGVAESPFNRRGAAFVGKGYIEIGRKTRKMERDCNTKTLIDMREDIEKLAKKLYRLRANEKEQLKNSPELEIDQQESTHQELELSSYVDGPVEHLSFTVRTPDRRLLLKKFTGITVSRNILEMLRDRKVRVNEIVIYDFAIVCKSMDTVDVWKGILEDNPAFARVDRFQILHMLRSSCCQHFTIHAIVLRDFLVENWIPWETPKFGRYEVN